MRGFSPKVPRPSTAYSIQHSKRIVYSLFCIHKKSTCPKNALSVYAVRICKKVCPLPDRPFCVYGLTAGSRMPRNVFPRSARLPDGCGSHAARSETVGRTCQKPRVTESKRYNRPPSPRIRPRKSAPTARSRARLTNPGFGVDSCVFRSAFSPFGFNNTISSECYISSRTPYTLPKSKRTLRPKPL